MNNLIKIILIGAVLIGAAYFLSKTVSNREVEQSGLVFTPAVKHTPKKQELAQMHVQEIEYKKTGECALWISSNTGEIPKGFIHGKISIDGCTPDYVIGSMALVNGGSHSDGKIPTGIATTSIKKTTITIENNTPVVGGDTIWATQMQMFILGYLTTPTGTLDPATVISLKSYQYGQGLDVSGEITPETIAALTASLAKVDVAKEQK